MSVDYKSLSSVLKNLTRRKIVLVLKEKGSLSHGDLMGLTDVMSTEKVNYHLKVLGDLIEKKNGVYSLSEKGRMAAEFLEKFPEQKPSKSSLRMADAALIGFAGVALTFANPTFWCSVLLSTFDVKVPLPFLLIQTPLISVYTFFVPGALMWILLSDALAPMTCTIYWSLRWLLSCGY